MQRTRLIVANLIAIQIAICRNAPLVAATNGQQSRSESGDRSIQSNLPKQQINQIDFEMVDFEVTHRVVGGLALLQAYKVRQRNPLDASLQWVSVGYPVLARNRFNQTLHFDPESVSVYLKLLDDAQRLALVAKARRLHDLDPSLSPDDVIRPLPLNQFTCTTHFLQDDSQYEAIGRVTDFNRTPLKLTFPVPIGTKKRAAFEKRLRLNAGLTLTCELTSTGRQEQTASLSISSDQFQRMNLTNKMFGPASEVYVSRKQAVELSGEIMSALRVEEQYDSDADQFSESYVQGLVKLAHSSFQPVTFDQALASLSGYGLSLGQNGIEPNAIKTALQNEFRIVDTNRKQLLTVGDGSARASNPAAQAIFETFDGDQDRQFVESKRNVWNQSTLSIDQQVAEINRRPGRNIRWERLGNGSITPKEVTVLKMDRNILGHNMKLEVIKRKPKAIPFQKSFLIELDKEDLLRSNIQESSSTNTNNSREASASGNQEIREQIKQILRANPIKHECRWQNSTGFVLRVNNAILDIEVLKVLDKFLNSCENRIGRSMNETAENGNIKLVTSMICKQSDKTNVMRGTVMMPNREFYLPISVKVMHTLSSSCRDTEYLKSYGVDFRHSNSITHVWSYSRCCKLVYNL